MSDVESIPPATPPRSSTKTIVIAVIVVLVAFVSGAAAGILADHVRMIRRGHGPHDAPRMIHHLLSHRLDLTPEQDKKVKEILDRHHERIRALNESVRPQIRRELEAANAEIEAVLTPEQRAKYEKIKMRLERHGDRGRRGPTR